MCECNAPVAEWIQACSSLRKSYHLPRTALSYPARDITRDRKTVWSVFWHIQYGTIYLSNCEIELFKSHRLVKSSRSEKERNLDRCDSPKGSSGQTQFLTDNHGTGISPVSQDTRSLSFVSGRLHEGFQSKTKRRACSDLPPASGQRSSDQAKKHGSCVDHSTADLYSLDQVHCKNDFLNLLKNIVHHFCQPLFKHFHVESLATLTKKPQQYLNIWGSCQLTNWSFFNPKSLCLCI